MRGFFVYRHQGNDHSSRQYLVPRIRKGSLQTNSILKKVIGTIEEHRLFRVGDTVIVAVSGGPDSVALLDILASLRELRLAIIVAHMNHNLRGIESDADEEFVRDLAGEYGFIFEVAAVDVREVSKRRRLSLEEAGRVTRYAWLDTVAAKYGTSLVALGHHADDQAETFLLRLLRGSGTTGLGGMKPLSAEKYVRPLLRLTRSEIISYLEKKGLRYRNDSSNDDINFLRNRIRHECIPYLRSYNPALTERINMTAEVLAADEAVLEAVTEQAFAQYSGSDGSGPLLRLQGVRTELPGVRMRLYRRAILAVKRDLARITSSHLKQIDRLVFSSCPSGNLSLPERLKVVRSYETLLFSFGERISDAGAWEVTIDGPGSYLLPEGGRITIEIVAAPENPGSLPLNRACFDAVTVRFPLTVRTYRPGDRFRPFGMSGSKKVKDFFIDSKVPMGVRRRLPILFSGKDLLWICGLRVAEAGRISSATREVLEVEIPEITP
jgi:tRNA(Ile)-lysidine synthase